MSSALAHERQLPVTAKERAQWMLHRLAAGRGICNIGFALRVDAPLRWWPLQEALNQIARRHPALRTTFPGNGSRLTRRVLDAGRARMALETIACAEEELDETLTELIATPLDVENGPLGKAYAVMLPTSTVVCFVLHHLIADWTTAWVVMRETSLLYDAFASGRELPPELAGEVPASPESAPDQEALDYWCSHLAGADPAESVLPGARQVPARPTFAGGRLDRSLSREAVAAVSRLRARTRSTENIVMLAAFYLLLVRHGAGPDLVVGVPVNTRRSGAGETLGYHVSTLPLRVPVDLDARFDDLVKTVRSVFLTGLEHGEASFEAVQPMLENRSGHWRTPLFHHSFNFRPAMPDEELSMTGLPVTLLDVGHGLSRLDLEFIVFAGPDAIDVRAVFSTEAHDADDIAALLDRYESLLIGLGGDSAAPVGAVDLSSEDDRRIGTRLNATACDWPTHSPVTVPELVFAQAQRSPDTLAVGDWSYRRLLETAAGVAERLSEAGVGPGDVVGLFADRGPLAAAAALGVWTVGAAYLPLDPGHAAQRMAHQIADAGVKVLVTDRPVPADSSAGLVVVPADTVGRTAPRAPVPGPLAYVIYTSGSTGRPKGVEVDHHALANVVRHFADALALTAEDRVLWLTTFSFDISALELFMPLCRGARVVPVPDDVRLDAAALAAVIDTENVTVAQATPTTWRHLAAEPTVRLRGMRVLCGGEPLTAALADQLLSHGCRLFNVYGPTETTIWSTAAELHRPVPERVPIGTPIANTTVTVRDVAGRPVPPGVPGELCISGVGLARGYRGDEELTAARFRHDPDQGRYYRTGDIVRLRTDGVLECLGRDDRQVKVRGHRIDLGEVETALEEHSEIATAVALTLAGADGTVIAAACLPTAGPLPPEQADALVVRLHAHARGLLPTAAVPARYLVVDELPLTGNGKIDHRALAERFTLLPTAEPARLPDDPTLRALVEAWREILGDPRLGVSSHFFASGGHSLAAVRLADRIGRELGEDIGFDAVFQAPTPADFAVWLGEKRPQT
ncbi:amino acid adenylation domain-containing protein [Streptomyces sp. NPDC007856]|uniref:non-ribosomal peptide synthetase n=1 Tax=Streptomyces sp. NPDC007856 TaxID=3364781 RepID=UPI00369E74D1